MSDERIPYPEPSPALQQAIELQERARKDVVVSTGFTNAKLMVKWTDDNDPTSWTAVPAADNLHPPEGEVTTNMIEAGTAELRLLDLGDSYGFGSTVRDIYLAMEAAKPIERGVVDREIFGVVYAERDEALARVAELETAARETYHLRWPWPLATHRQGSTVTLPVSDYKAAMQQRWDAYTRIAELEAGNAQLKAENAVLRTHPPMRVNAAGAMQRYDPVGRAWAAAPGPVKGCEVNQSSRVAQSIFDALCEDKKVWATHGRPSEEKERLIVAAIAAALAGDAAIGANGCKPTTPQFSIDWASEVYRPATTPQPEHGRMWADDAGNFHVRGVYPPIGEPIVAGLEADLRQLMAIGPADVLGNVDLGKAAYSIGFGANDKPQPAPDKPSAPTAKPLPASALRGGDGVVR